MGSRMGRAIVANASMQFLLKQSPSAVDVLTDVFKLTSEERKRLSQFPVGQGLFFAGQNHVHLQVIASQTEMGLITTNPEQVEAMKTGEIGEIMDQGTIDPVSYTHLDTKAFRKPMLKWLVESVPKSALEHVDLADFDLDDYNKLHMNI